MRVLMTGASGTVGTMLRHHWGASYMLRLADITEPANIQAHEEFVSFELASPEDCVRICAGIDVVVHLAADAGSADFLGSLLPRNIIGPFHLLEAASATASVQRVVLVSSVYAVRGSESKLPVTPDQPPHPMGLYGATKCWVEALGRVYAEGTAGTPATRTAAAGSNHLGVIVVRLGNPRMDQGSDNWCADDRAYILTPRDCAALFARCVDIKHSDIPPFLIVHGSSDHTHQYLDLESTKRWLGYEPQDGTAHPRRSTGDMTFNGKM
jgi:uronate dehydrogenase